MEEAQTCPFALAVERDMRKWMELAVIGLNLCPFAKAVHARGLVHYAVSRAPTPRELERDLVRELQSLVVLDSGVRDTTLLMAPSCLADFMEFNAFLRRADRVLAKLELEGVVQIAAFHPDFQFANSGADDIANYTNRAPYPTLHLLREGSVALAVKAFPEAESIFERNIRTMETLGLTGWGKLGLTRTAPLPTNEGACVAPHTDCTP